MPVGLRLYDHDIFGQKMHIFVIRRDGEIWKLVFVLRHPEYFYR